jgi:polysaccharide deacetylase 2 family uncharacterized protein YibQ
MQALFGRHLAVVPSAIGVNNQMGSLFTANEAAIGVVLEMVRDRGLFFLDSVTASDSVAFQIARRLGVKTGQRQVFLDNVQDVSLIVKQLEKLVVLAEDRGQAIGIGHPHEATLEALVGFRQELSQRVRLVGVHRLMR